MRLQIFLARLAAVAGFAMCPSLAQAGDRAAWTVEAAYAADLIARVDHSHAGRVLDNLDVILEGDLEQAVGWRGATIHAYLLNNSGGQPSQVAPTLQGIDNIEVSRARTRLYELWVEQDLSWASATIKAGLYDLNSEFYVTEASGVFINPSFGIGPDLSSTGVNGPSIFPSTALGVRLKREASNGYFQVAVLNADARTWGDPGGPSLSADAGTLAIAEASRGSEMRIALGAWRYSKPLPGERDEAFGVYGLAERSVAFAYGAGWIFARGGVRDAPGSAVKASVQAGVSLSPSARPDDVAALGVATAWLSEGARREIVGRPAARAETTLEFSYRLQASERISIQPDLQIVWNREGVRGASAVVGGVRFEVVLFAFEAAR